jgi:hypothetical protein
MYLQSLEMELGDSSTTGLNFLMSDVTRIAPMPLSQVYCSSSRISIFIKHAFSLCSYCISTELAVVYMEANKLICSKIVKLLVYISFNSRKGIFNFLYIIYTGYYFFCLNLSLMLLLNALDFASHQNKAYSR